MSNGLLSAPKQDFHPSEQSNLHRSTMRPPLCFIVDSEEAHRHSISLFLQSQGIETGVFPKTYALCEGLSRRTPDLVFLDVPPAPDDAFEAVRALADRSYRGLVQLMSGAKTAGMEVARQLGERNRLRILPTLHKPIERAAISRLLQENNLHGLHVTFEPMSLAEALSNDWIEFWYQPKIDLRKKQLAGVELFARVRHPQHGIVLPGVFMQDADEKSLILLTEKSVVHALKAGLSFAKLGITFPLAVNVSLSTLAKLPISAIMREYRSKSESWPGLILDVTENQLVGDLPLVRELIGQLEPWGIKFAIDDFGRGNLPLMRLKDIPLAELKLDRSFVGQCSSEKTHAAICKTVIGLAHNFEIKTVAVGVENQADAHTLFRMGCDLGQGYLFAQPMAQDRFLALLRQRANVRPALAVH